MTEITIQVEPQELAEVTFKYLLSKHPTLEGMDVDIYFDKKQGAVAKFKQSLTVDDSASS